MGLNFSTQARRERFEAGSKGTVEKYNLTQKYFAKFRT